MRLILANSNNPSSYTVKIGWKFPTFKHSIPRQDRRQEWYRNISNSMSLVLYRLGKVSSEKLTVTFGAFPC